MYFLSTELNGALEPGLLSWAAGRCAEPGRSASPRLLAGGQDSADSLAVREMSPLLGKVTFRNVDGPNRLKIMIGRGSGAGVGLSVTGLEGGDGSG